MDSTAQALAIIGGTVIPLLTGALTRLDGSSGRKAMVAAVLSAAVAAATAATSAGRFEWQALIVLFGETLVMNVATYLGVWKPVGVLAPGSAGGGIVDRATRRVALI